MKVVATKIFDVVESSTPEMWYKIEIYFHGKVVETFEKPTMQEALFALELAGYKREIQP